MNTSLLPITKLLEKFSLILLDNIDNISNIDYNTLSHTSKIFLNGDWYANTNNIIDIYKYLLDVEEMLVLIFILVLF